MSIVILGVHGWVKYQTDKFPGSWPAAGVDWNTLVWTVHVGPVVLSPSH